MKNRPIIGTEITHPRLKELWEYVQTWVDDENIDILLSPGLAPNDATCITLYLLQEIHPARAQYITRLLNKAYIEDGA